MNQFKPTDIDRQGERIAKLLPTGKAWDGAIDTNTNMGKLLKSLGIELYRIELLIQTVNSELDLNRAIDLIREWEESVGIPDDCFEDITDTTLSGLESRRKNILIKLRNIRLQTAQDYIDLAAEFGETITVTPAMEIATFPLEFPIIFIGSTKSAKFTIIVNFELITVEGSTFPLPFPFEFLATSASIVQCLLTAIKPANCNILFTHI